jgi:putative transposase
VRNSPASEKENRILREEPVPPSARTLRDGRLKVLIRTSFGGSKGRYGRPRIYADLRDQQERVSRKRVIRLMQKEPLGSGSGSRVVRRVIMVGPSPPICLDRQFTATAPKSALGN